MYYTIIDS